MRMLTILLLCAAGILETGCSAFKTNTTDGVKTVAVAEFKGEVPDWYTNDSLTTDKMIYVSATDVSKHMQFAIDKAMMNARVELANRVNVVVESMIRETVNEQGTADMKSIDREVDRVSKIVTKQSLTMYKREKLFLTKEKDGYRAFVLLSLPLDESRRLVDNNSKSEQREKKFKELDKQSRSSDSTVELLDVDNEEYKKRRDAALQKPGAVVGQYTIR